MTLAMLEGIGPERAVMYLKKLQGELKNKTPTQLWEELHPDIEGAGRNSLFRHGRRLAFLTFPLKAAIGRLFSAFARETALMYRTAP